MSTTITSLNDLFKAAYGALAKPKWTPEMWAQHDNVTQEDLQLYENARIGSSPLMQSMHEGDKRDMAKGLLDNLYNGPMLIVNPRIYNDVHVELSKKK